MADFKKNGAKHFYDNHSNGFNRRSTGRPAFAQKKWDESSRPTTMHKAVCAQCGNSCEVPFRPFNNRLVYCNECFREQKGREGRDYDKSPQKNYSDHKKSFKLDYRNDSGNGNNSELKDQLQTLNTKIDRLIRAIEKMTGVEVSSPNIGTDKDTETSPAGKSKKSDKKVFKNYKRPF